MPLGGLLQGTEALQSPVHAGGPHAKTHRGKTAQVHGEIPLMALGAPSPDSSPVITFPCLLYKYSKILHFVTI